MTRSNRAYVPKIRGCHECSQRRIHCDRSQPDCAKCAAKGIQCSGFGTRYRFSIDANPQRKARGKREARLAPQPTPSSLLHPPVNAGGDFSSIPPSPADTLNAWKSYCLLYFSERIAPELMVVDDQYNGWRHLVLPIAHTDELVRSAVLATSAFHLSANVSAQPIDPRAAYQEVLHGLRRKQDLQAMNVTEKQTLVLALLLLLTTVIVSGDFDFQGTFKLLEAALSAFGGEEFLMSGELGIFLVRQIRKFRGYAAPLLNQSAGVAILNQTASTRPSSSNGWECFRFYYYSYPTLSRSLSLVYDLHEQACQIYMARVSMGANGVALTQLVDRFKLTMEALPVGSPGEHTLVWATFLVALESSTPEHQEYFVNVLTRHHQRSGFSNIVTALHHLRSKWAEHTAQDWTKWLPELQTFIV